MSAEGKLLQVAKNIRKTRIHRHTNTKKKFYSHVIHRCLYIFSTHKHSTMVPLICVEYIKIRIRKL